MTEQTWQRVFVIVPAQRQGLANALAAQIDPGKRGGRTFSTVKLSPTGEPPVTHYACSALMNPDGRAATGRGKTDHIPKTAIYDAADGWTWSGVLADLNLKQIIVADEGDE